MPVEPSLPSRGEKIVDFDYFNLSKCRDISLQKLRKYQARFRSTLPHGLGRLERRELKAGVYLICTWVETWNYSTSVFGKNLSKGTVVGRNRKHDVDSSVPAPWSVISIFGVN